MKKLLLILVLILVLAVPAIATTDSVVCEKSYKWNNYSMKFSTSPFGPGCSGSVELVSPGKQSAIYQFTMSDNFVTVFGIGEFVLQNTVLILIYPDGIRLTEY